MSSAVKKSRRIHVSKNRKKNWGKFCDVTDVENFLEDQRLEERTGGPVSEKCDEELFFVDTTKKSDTVAKRTRGLKALKCHQILNAYSQVPVPVNPQKRPPSKKKQQLLAKKEEKKLKKKVLASNHKQIKDDSPSQFRDLWADDEKEKDSGFEEIKDLIDFKNEITRKKPVIVPPHLYQKPSLLPAVEVPHPGASYNPSFIEHQELLSKAVEIEQKKLKEELHLKRILYDMFPTKDKAPTEATWIEEMSQGLFEKDDPTEIANDDGTLLANPPVTDENRKSKSKRRKQKELKDKLRQKKLEKEMRKKMNDVYRIKQIKAEIRKAENLTKEREAKRQQREIDKMYKPRTLGPCKYEPNDLEVNLTEELPESMRVLKTEGNLFEDRYKSLQRRNLIEPRMRQKRKRKYKLKVQVKRSHRNFE